MSDAEGHYTRATAVAAEGERVGFVTCLRCGATLTLHPRDDFDVTMLHDSWHEGQSR